MEKKPRTKKLSDKQALTVKKHIEKIQEAHKELQQALSEFGFEPANGWKDPTTFQLVKGIEFVNSDDDCDECSVVCFDGDCGECLECAGDVVNYKNIRVNSYPADRVLVESVRTGGLRVQFKGKST